MHRRPPPHRARVLSGAALSFVLVARCVGQPDTSERPSTWRSPNASPDAGPHTLTPREDPTPVEHTTHTFELDPGRVTLHRLNRAEYNNSVRDLLGTARKPADEFPADDRGYGYDNIADVLSLSPVQIELYLRAAEQLVTEALANPAAPSTRAQFEGEALTGTVGQATSNAWNLWSNGTVSAAYTAPVPGQYRVTVRAWQTRAGSDHALMSLTVGGTRAPDITVANESGSPGEFATTVMIRTAGRTDVTVGFLNDFLVETPTRQDRNLYVDWIRVEGPLDAMTRVNPARQRILVCAPSATMTEAQCAREIFSRFGRHAWRRPLTASELTDLGRFLDVARTQGEGFESGVALGLQAMLVSPHFVFRVELDTNPTATAPHALNDHELAARLSYFLWSSTPDATLEALADRGELNDPAVLRAQVTRMLADPKARALTENFAGQWLYTRGVADHDVNATLFPQLTDAVRDSFRAEADAYFDEFLRGDLSMRDFLTADFTFVDDRLAAWYGLTAPGMGLRRVMLRGSNRAGALMHGSFLTVTSHPDRTSPVKRGQWVLGQLLCEPPRPPPPNVEGLPPETNPTGTLRERMERHRTQPSCAACHQLMDPIGFGLENFDAIGRWRTTDSGFAIDPSGALPGGGEFRNAQEMTAQLARDSRYPRCVTQQLFTYALGRGPEDYDQATLDRIAAAWSADGMRLRDLVTRIVLSDSFRQRRGEAPTGATP